MEIFEEDGVNNFFEIDNDILKNKSLLINEEIFSLQYNANRLIGILSGKILSIKNDKMLHTCVTDGFSSGSPLIRRY